MMQKDLLSIMQEARLTEMRDSLARCNETTERYGLSLTAAEAGDLLMSRSQSLRDAGRVEFGEGILPKLILAFCDSPYITQEDYAETLSGLQDCFYYYKSASEERFGDDDLLSMMRAAFDGEAEGSVEFLAETTMDELCRSTRLGDEREPRGRAFYLQGGEDGE